MTTAEAASLRGQAERYRRMLAQIDDARAKEALAQTIAKLEADAGRIEVDAVLMGGLKRRFYTSENGDAWFLAMDASDELWVVHQANDASGGQQTKSELTTFLTTDSRQTPQHSGLLRLITSMLEQTQGR